ncbi:polyphosphate kinase 1 [Candidatus Thiothrix sp. Deng01]|uniref:Polyphosphate kinase n=1 Tax=Candidatus Thiothrix phosphatis TaxID=3112415 RepID=A0ABU6CY84_9GAMM|nr:polyphosphate kinase 1 [Candidatus Thiothrix sp. Deng01]MEB4591792.1 polyphosphate kinase 1 [Candidatus Thiothrix sp. Deng01]
MEQETPLLESVSYRLDGAEYYINRELSLLAFNRRVLELAQDPDVPLLERLRFLCISSSNMDEFFEVRVASLKQQLQLEAASVGADGLTPAEALQQISVIAHALVERQYQLLNEVLIPALHQENIFFVRRNHWDERQHTWLSDYFDRELMPLLSPLGLDPAHPFPNVINKSLNFIVSLCGTDAFGREIDTAIVQAPRTLPRIIRLPADMAQSANSFVFLSSVLHAFIGRLFPGMEVQGCYQFRLTRNSNMYVDEEEVDDLLQAMQGELPQRNYGAVVRLEISDHCPQDNIDYLMEQFDLCEKDLYNVNGPVNLNRLMAIADLVERPDLRFPPFRPAPSLMEQHPDLFGRIRQEDVLLHHPYQSFQTVTDFIAQAANDPNVLAIKMTLYRTGKQSELAKQLAQAARAGKEVTVVVELRARFDEEANIGLANQLQNAGAHVVYGVVGYKTHAKLCLVVRREHDCLRRYAHLGTGNYHSGTARLYTDFGLLTCHPDITEDVHKVFHMLTGLGRVRDLKHLLESPFTLHQAIMEKIRRETGHARNGKAALIRGRMNALIEPQVIRALYQASQAGVKVELIVRGVCCLRPGIAGVSDNIRVRSVMGRFLEHPRVFYFLNDGEEELYCSSADWMPRNFFRRVEVAFPILTPALRRRIIHEAFELHLQDNSQAWELQADGEYQRQQPEDGTPPISAQTNLLKLLGKG